MDKRKMCKACFEDGDFKAEDVEIVSLVICEEEKVRREKEEERILA